MSESAENKRAAHLYLQDMDQAPSVKNVHRDSALRYLLRRQAEREAEQADELVERLRDEQHKRCAYGTRDGDGQTCDCKFPLLGRPNSSEMTGCAELREAIRVLTNRP